MKESEIRPQAIFDEYLKYCKDDLETFFKIENNYIDVNCPACGKNDIKESFIKDKFTYNWCKSCRTLYVSPLPPKENFRKYYTEGKSIKFWATDFYKHTEAARKEQIYKPRVELIENIFKEEFKADINILIDIGAGYGTFCEVALESDFFKQIIAIEPSPPLVRSLENKNITVIEKFMEQITIDDFQNFTDGTKLFCTFELWEHLYTPRLFLEAIENVMNKGDYLLITTLNILGFDLLMLWEKSKSINPPHHINLFNLESLKSMLKNYGFKIKKAFTPGKLDVDIVKNMKVSFEDHLSNYLINDSSEGFRKNLQDFIEQNKMSSHMWIIAQK
jgi:2-polyprenyl-3-methyl-5-hydroxy-6-metoxy-1,4-benzoquinol methylase